MKNRNRLIMGSALGLASIAVAIDHTKHRLPDPIPVSQEQMSEEEESPCGMSAESPCSMDDESSSPCSMSNDDDDSSPCGLGD